MIRTISNALLAATLSWAEAAPLTFTDAQGLAINGYDPVAYFTSQKAVKGSGDHTFQWNGAQWRFASADHRDQFAKNPAQFAPQYGGYCAYGMSRGYKAATVPGAFTVVNGKLYLNYNAQVQETWRKDSAGYIRQADAQWPQVKDSPTVRRER